MSNCCSSSGMPVIIGGTGVGITGGGTPADPIRISISNPVTIQGESTSTVQTSVTGSGEPDSPYVIQSNATLRVQDLSDVLGSSNPTTGHVLMWNGTNWVSNAAPTQAPGQVNVDPGLTGDGTVATPIAIDVSDTVTTSTDGLDTYIDSDGKLRAAAPPSTIEWANVTSKPVTFPPSSHQHVPADIPGLRKGTTAPADTLGNDGDWYAQYAA